VRPLIFPRGLRLRAGWALAYPNVDVFVCTIFFQRAEIMRAFISQLAIVYLLCGAALSAPSLANATDWTGGGTGNSWATGSNWSDGNGPGPSETAYFYRDGTTGLPNEVTNVLDADRTIGGLAYLVNSGFHTSDLAGHTMTIDGNLNFNTDVSHLTTTTIRNGVLIVDHAFADLNVAPSYTTTARSNVDLSGLTRLEATVREFNIATTIASGVTGELTLADENTIDATSISIGVASGSQGATGRLHMGGINTFLADDVLIGGSYSNADVDVPAGSTVNLGADDSRARLSIGKGTTNTNSTYRATLDLSGAAVNAYLSDLTVGHKNPQPGGQYGTFLGGNSGTISIGTATATANLVVGDYAHGTLDLSGMESLVANLDEMRVGIYRTGDVSFPTAVNLDAREITIGDMSSGNGIVTWGRDNTILADEILIGGSYAHANVTTRAGGTFDLGSADRRVSLTIGKGTTNTNSTYNASIDLSNATVNAYLDHLIVGQKNPQPGGQTATFNGGDGGTISIGTAGDTANVTIGDRATTTVDLGAMDALVANLDRMTVATHASGTLVLPDAVAVDVRTMVLGDDSGTANVTWGRANTILADEILIGGSYSNATVTTRAGGTFDLGAADRRVSLTIGKGITNTNNTYRGSLDLSGATVNAHLDHLIVGQKNAQSGGQMGDFIGGDGGTISIGAVGDPANVTIGDRATTTVDLGAMDALVANLDTMTVGKRASAVFTLPDSVDIDARAIVLGDDSGTANVKLGETNTILADEILIGGSYSNADVTARSSGVVTIGSPSKRASLTIGKGITDTNRTYHGTLDLTNVTTTAYLDHVIVGEKNNLSGGQRGTLTISDHDANHIDANSIVIGGTRATGVFDFGGGTLIATTIEKGPGTADFNWFGGALHVATFGAAARPFDLENTGDGVLAPGTSAGTTQVHGDYQQSAFATTEIELGGTAPGTEHDQLNVSGTATLAGTLDLDLIDSYAPIAGDSMDVVTYNNRSGQYGFVDPPALPANVAFELDYTTDPQKLAVQMVTPSRSSLVSPLSVDTWSNRTAWSSGTVPQTTSDTQVDNQIGTAQQLLVQDDATVHRVTVSGSTGPMTLSLDSGVRLAAANSFTVEESGNVQLGDGRVITGAFDLAGGTLAGGGNVEVDGALTNAGLVSPGNSPGILRVDGDYSQTSAGTLLLEIGGLDPVSEFDVLEITRHASLGGALEVVLIGGFEPEFGDEFAVMTFASADGRFDEYRMPDLDDNLRLDVRREPQGLSLIAVPEPSASVLGALALLGVGCFRALQRRSRPNRRQ